VIKIVGYVQLFIVTIVMLSGGQGLAAEPVLEDLSKKTESSAIAPLAPAIPAGRITTGTPLIPKAEKVHSKGPDEVKSTPEEPATPVTPAARREISPLERLITGDELVNATQVSDVNLAKGLSQFGYTFFKNVSFAPQLDVPVSPDYLVDSGDAIVVTVWGSIEGSYELTVNRSGEIVLPKVGTIRVAGVQFGKLQELLRSRLGKVFRDFDLAVNMGKLRTIKVYVVGEVEAPGDYTISGLSTLLNALSAAGGPTKNGSLRNLKIRRAGREDESVDLYDFFTKGDKSRDIRLQSGDAIFVPVIGPVAAIAGSVKRPAIYELKNEKTLKELISLAEGITATGFLQRVQISRVIANEKKQVLDVNLDPSKTGKSIDELTASLPVQDMDIVRIFPINNLLRDHFKVEGHVERPGFYAMKPGVRLSSVLTKENLLPEYAPTVVELTRLFPPDYHPQLITVNLAAVLAGDSTQDLELWEFDTVRVFSRWDLEERPFVRVSGEVQKPGEYGLVKGMTVRELLVQAGNPKNSAYLKTAEISRLQLRADKAELKPVLISLEEALKGNPAHNLVLEPFDELNVRKMPNWSEEKERYVALAGEFVFPGVYPVTRGERLSSVIARAGGFTDKAYLKGAKFTREAVRRLQQLRMDEALARAHEEILKKQTSVLSASASKEELEATKATLEGLERTIALLKGKKAEGRLIITLETPERLKGSPSDIELAGSDMLSVPADPSSVNILGSVYNPATSLFEQGRDVGYYLDKVGGVTHDGDEDEMYLVKVDGTVQSHRQASSFLFFDSFRATQVDSGDTLVVPQKLERTAWLRDIKDITTIISQIALSAGTVFLGLR
jgi:protein involved in polysaccharide export with SLBB domain